MDAPIHIISLGAGVQSSTMALMAAAGDWRNNDLGNLERLCRPCHTALHKREGMCGV